MSSLLPEVLDLIVDHLHDEPKTLKTCCVVSKSWIHRTRKHLFARVELHAQESHIELWKKAFPDPSTSPAHHTLTLSIHGIPIVTAGDADGWIRSFFDLVHLHLEWIGPINDQLSLAPFHGLSPTLRSLRLIGTSLEVLDLVCSFPLLKDLALVSLHQGSDTWNTPSTSPKLTGSLELNAIGGICAVARRLLDLPYGLRFTKITVWCFSEDAESTTDLVSRCSDTLESLTLYSFIAGALPSAYVSGQYLPLVVDVVMPGTPRLDLSKATKLKSLSFQCGAGTVRWITAALKTVRSKHLQQIVIHPYGTLVDPVEERILREWQDLDRLLAQFWTTHSIRLEIVYEVRDGRRLLPELARRGLFDSVANT
jgi:hypothetical protein